MATSFLPRPGYAGHVKIAATMLRPDLVFVTRPATASLDRVQLSGAATSSAPEIPDARSIAADPKLRYVDLNRAINRSYRAFGELMQEVVDPSFHGRSSAYPTWYGMAIFASRMAGRSMQAADQALEVVKQVDAGRSLSACVEGGQDLEARLDGLGLWGNVKLCATFLVAYLNAQQEAGTRASAWFDPRTLTVAAHRMARAMVAGQGPPLERLTALVKTMENALEDGNRRIFTDIGVAGQTYCEARQAAGGPLGDERLLAMAPQPEEARAVLQAARQAIEQGRPMPTCANTTNMLWASFALYEEAGRSPAGRRDPCIHMANDMMAWHEQFTVVQPAFHPPTPVPGELDRYLLFSAVTPSVAVNTREGTWRYSRFAARHLPPRDDNPLTPRVTEYNWANFEDRWPGIVDFFGRCYVHPERIWPMPPAEPSAPL